MKRITSFILIASVIFFQLSSFVVAETHEELVSKYINLSGFADILPTFPEHFEAIFAQRQLVSADPESEKEIASIISDSFDLAKAENHLFSIILENSDIEFLKRITTWQESPLVQKILAEEKKSSGPEEQANLLHYIADLQSDPPSQSRIEIIQELEKSTHQSEVTTNMVIEILRGMVLAVNSNLPEDERQTEGDIDKELVTFKSQMKEGLRQQLILSSFYTYQNISNEELVEYIQFYKSDSGKKEIDIINKAFTAILRSWFLEVGERLADLAKEKNASNTCR